MNIADQIGFGICLALIPYLAWSMGTAVLNTILDRVAPVQTPLQLNRIITDIHFNGVVTAEGPPSIHTDA